MRTFTNARVDMHNNGGVGSGSRTVKPRKLETAKMENLSENGGGKDSGGHAAGLTGSVGLMSGIVVKDDTVKGIFTENIQTSGAYCTREEGLKREVSYEFLGSFFKPFLSILLIYRLFSCFLQFRVFTLFITTLFSLITHTNKTNNISSIDDRDVFFEWTSYS